MPWWSSKKINIWPARIILAIVAIFDFLGWTRILPLDPQFTWFGLFLQALTVWGGLEIINYVISKRKIQYPITFAAIMFALLVAADAFGDMGSLYEKFVWYDQVMHFFGGFSTSILVTGFMLHAHKYRLENRLRRFEVFMASIGVTTLGQVIYEMEEYYEDFFTGSHRLGDGFDTANDLSLGLYGAIAATLILFWFYRVWKTKK